ncbi:hypothetical protein MAM1_0419c10420 [Mucor ambiguus]|uniref:HAUS augmin-like complex subunit 6 N-terminal domain-containing protein n=1 Tax=Mucor ambiguus TaxID=91626 RepID=A0A0C9LYB0_9FUNG|nr:hypothetical protein MAM1_0419c10420 [Mucor ambiguus]
MSIKTLIHNLKLLGFDEARHGKGTIKLNEKLFTHGAINNDKALEHICLFLFRKIDRLRVKKELLPTLNTHTYASRQHFVTNAYKWLLEIRQKTHLLNGVPLRKSELSTYQGVNLVKIMVAFSTYVLESTLKHTDVGKISRLPKTAIQDSIVQANQSFDLNIETNNTYVSKATEAAKEISTELSSSPPPPPPSQNTIPVESESIRRLNRHLESIFHNLHSMLPKPVNEKSTIVEEPFTSAFYEESTTVERSSNSVSFESLRAMEESSASVFMGQAIAVEESPIPVIPDYSEAVNEPLSAVSAEQPSTVEELPIPVIVEHPDTMHASTSSLFAEQPTSVEEPTSSVHVEEPNTTVTPPSTSSFPTTAAAASNVTAEAPSFNTTTSGLSSPEPDSREPEVPNINLSSAKRSVTNIYLPEGSRMITTPNYIPRSLTPDEQRDVPDAPHTASQRKPCTTTHNTTFSSRSASRIPIVLAPMHFNYLTESGQLPSIRNTILRYTWNPFTDSPYWYLPPISHTSSTQPHPSPNARSASPLSPKRKFEEEDQDNIVVPLSPPRQRRRITQGYHDEGAMTPTAYDMDLVPPLMDEAAPFRRIYNTDYFDIDFMTPRR